jgi:hypothetical protein
MKQGGNVEEQRRGINGGREGVLGWEEDEITAMEKASGSNF